ncbi:ATP-binding protein [Marinobacter salarius]|uniref:ATP-binding protein n=1 Tax=Marinobacter salarius TaxID=1420917 RepID=UPI00273CC8FD|nr:ATP-binding protein [Marinobacter salarius]MDP4531694.1 ATP-binding protein [Marinobacter salarius]
MIKGNVLGDVRAEQDIKMLETAFWESSDYKSLLESYDRPIIVGRRGTGKSALAHKLAKHWSSKPNISVIKIAPEEEQVIGLRDIFDLFGDKYLHIKAGTKMAWRYAIYMEVISDISSHYKYQKNIDSASIRKHIIEWGAKRKGIASKIRAKLMGLFSDEQTPQSRIADLSDALELELLEEVLLEALRKSKTKYIVFADKLDEGYSPDNLGVAIVDGFVQAVIDIKSKMEEEVIAFAFVRDYIYRAIAKLDPDFTRNIEGQTHRLHWDEYNLFNMVCNRIRVAFGSDIENNTRLWSKYAVRELTGKDGFRNCLKLTLYRPRDILVLLNEAFLRANSRERSEIVLEDIESTAKSISSNRLLDLHKEYEYIFPSLDEFTSCFYGSASELSVEEAENRVQPVLTNDRHERNKQQDIFIIGSSREVLQRLYSIGFIGLHNDQSSSFVFCHDGKDPDRDFKKDARLLIHPCYWLALGTVQAELKLDEAEDINDEYDIEVTSISKEQRTQKIGALLSELDSIPEGKSGAYDFESWCLKAIKIIFAGVLCNVEANPNVNGLQQRDVVATNLGETKFWKRTLEDYKSRKVVFEIKNYVDLKATEYRQVNSYLCNDYGSIAFIITRDHNNNLAKHRELSWAKEIFHNHKKIIIKLSFKFLKKHLRKLRSPQKHDALDKELNSLLDTYVRRYFSYTSK